MEFYTVLCFFKVLSSVQAMHSSHLAAGIIDCKYNGLALAVAPENVLTASSTIAQSAHGRSPWGEVVEGFTACVQTLAAAGGGPMAIEMQAA